MDDIVNIQTEVFQFFYKVCRFFLSFVIELEFAINHNDNIQQKDWKNDRLHGVVLE